MKIYASELKLYLSLLEELSLSLFILFLFLMSNAFIVLAVFIIILLLTLLFRQKYISNLIYLIKTKEPLIEIKGSIIYLTNISSFNNLIKNNDNKETINIYDIKNIKIRQGSDENQVHRVNKVILYLENQKIKIDFRAIDSEKYYEFYHHIKLSNPYI